MTSGEPVRKLQPATSAPYICAYNLSISGVSRSGSTVMEAKTTLLPKSAPSWSCTNDIIGVSTGQVAVHNVKMNVTATTLPRRSASEICAPSCEVNVNSGAGAIFGSGCSWDASWTASCDGCTSITDAGRIDASMANA